MGTDSGWCGKKPVELNAPSPRLGALRRSWDAQLPTQAVKGGTPRLCPSPTLSRTPSRALLPPFCGTPSAMFQH